MTTPQPGDRIRLVAMPDDPGPIPAGSTGTVTAVRDCGSGPAAWFQVDVDRDNGRKLMLSMPPDQFEVLPGGVTKYAFRRHARPEAIPSPARPTNFADVALARSCWGYRLATLVPLKP